MKVLHIVPSYYPATIYGGPIFSIHFANKELAKQGVQIFVSTTNANGNCKLDVSTSEIVMFSENYKVRYYNETLVGIFSLPFSMHISNDIDRNELVHLHDIFSLHAVLSIFLCAIKKRK